MRPQTILRAAAACAALGALFAAVLAAGAAPLHPDAAHAAARAAGTGAGDVAIARRRLDVVAGRHALLSGRVVAPAAAGRPVALQRRSGNGWRTLDRDRTAPDGGFAFRFRPRKTGSAVVRVRSGAGAEHVGRLNVYRHARVSWYGPGLYGGRLGCGGTLTPGTLGVANRTLPCGTKVTLRRAGRTVRVPVVDRGPFAGGREFDLTAATKERLGFGGAGTLLVAV
jgi:rare lipoprotein A